MVIQKRGHLPTFLSMKRPDQVAAGGVKLQEIGNLFEVGETAVVEAGCRFYLKMGEDKKFKKTVKRVKGNLKI